MSKFVSLSYYDLAELFRKSMCFPFIANEPGYLSVIKGSDRLIMLLITGCSILRFRGPPFCFFHIKLE